MIYLLEYTAAGTRSYETLSGVTKLAVAANVYRIRSCPIRWLMLAPRKKGQQITSHHMRARVVKDCASIITELERISDTLSAQMTRDVAMCSLRGANLSHLGVRGRGSIRTRQVSASSLRARTKLWLACLGVASHLHPGSGEIASSIWSTASQLKLLTTVESSSVLLSFFLVFFSWPGQTGKGRRPAE